MIKLNKSARTLLDRVKHIMDIADELEPNGMPNDETQYMALMREIAVEALRRLGNCQESIQIGETP